MPTTRIIRRIDAPRARIYETMLDAATLKHWKVPDGMTAVVHTFEPHIGGAIRVSLTYDAPTAQGKTSAHTDTYHGTFTELVPNQRIVEIDEFESDDPALNGAMTTIITLSDFGAGTEVTAEHENVPSGVSLTDNETGWKMALDKLAALVEA